MTKKILVLLLPFLTALAQDRKGRFEGFTEKASRGPKMRLVAATYFGGSGDEEFIAARTLPDGSIAAFGNSWGPDFPGTPVILGKGEHRGLKATASDPKGKITLRPDNPDIAGMVVLYSPDLSAIKKSFRFDWGVASLSAATLTADGKGFLLAGRSTQAFRALAGKGSHWEGLPPAPEAPAGKKRAPTELGPYEYEGVSVTGDVFLARMSAEGRLEWSWIWEGRRHPPDQVWTDLAGNVYLDLAGWIKISPDGENLKKISTIGGGGQAHWLGVDPADGSAFFGGDRNTHTGKEPWRQPYLYKVDPQGEKLWKIWEWPSKALRDGTTEGLQGLVADSSARAMDVGPGGDLYVGCWSDGGNSVLTRQPTDATKGVSEAPFRFDGSGMKGANSLAHVLRIDGKTLEARWHALWVSYFPANFGDPKKAGSPNGARIRQLRVCPNGAVAIAGSAASVLVQTPGAFYSYPGDGRGYGGDCVVVFDPEFSTLLFSSYLPGCENASICPTAKGLVVVSRSKGQDGEKEPTKSPAVNAIQAEKKGEWNAHILLLEMP
jgi:hypothetical protein